MKISLLDQKKAAYYVPNFICTQSLRPYSKSKHKLNSKKVELEWHKNFFVCVLYLSFLHLNPDFWYSSLSFVRLS